MKSTTTTAIALIAAVSLFPALGFAQTPAIAPPAPPTQPVPPVPPVPPHGHDRGPKVPVTYLGVETSELPNVVADQLGLAKGFGLVVDYVVPEGPAAAAGVQQNDILKMLNDQILTEPDQLSKLIRSYQEGTTVTLTVLRKGAETKLTAKLAKREVSQRRGMLPGFDKSWKHGGNVGRLGEEMNKLGEDLGNMNFNFVVDDAAAAARDEARQAAREAREAIREAAREGREAAREFRVTRKDNGALKTTSIDMNKAQIVLHDANGELKLENVNGKRLLTAKDPQGRLIFSGPVEAKEELDKVPAEVRQRYDKLEQKDLPTIAPTVTKDEDEDESDGDEVGNDDDSDAGDAEAVLQVLHRAMPIHPYRWLAVNTVLL